MVDNQHSKHSKANVSPKREAVLGQNIINFSKPSARWKQMASQIINTEETIFSNKNETMNMCLSSREDCIPAFS